MKVDIVKLLYHISRDSTIKAVLLAQGELRKELITVKQNSRMFGQLEPGIQLWLASLASINTHFDPSSSTSSSSGCSSKWSGKKGAKTLAGKPRQGGKNSIYSSSVSRDRTSHMSNNSETEDRQLDSNSLAPPVSLILKLVPMHTNNNRLTSTKINPAFHSASAVTTSTTTTIPHSSTPPLLPLLSFSVFPTQHGKNFDHLESLLSDSQSTSVPPTLPIIQTPSVAHKPAQAPATATEAKEAEAEKLLAKEKEKKEWEAKEEKKRREETQEEVNQNRGRNML